MRFLDEDCKRNCKVRLSQFLIFLSGFCAKSSQNVFFRRNSCRTIRHNIECVVNKDKLDATNGQTVKMDALAVNSDVVRIMKMTFSITPGWGDKHSETVEDFFHPQNSTLSVRTALGMKID